MEKKVTERVDKWKKKLIDLTKRNRLISFKPTKVTTIRVVDEQPPEVFATLAVANKSMDFLPLPEEEENKDNKESESQDSAQITIDTATKEFQEYDKENLAGKHIDLHLQTNLPEIQLEKNLFRIHSSASSVMEEQGYNVLFLAVGFLEWYESSDSEVKLKSPLILIPVEMTRLSVKKTFKIKYNEDSVIINPALKQKLSIDFGIEIDVLDDDVEKINLQDVFHNIQTKIEAKQRWRVTNDIYLGLFSFAKFMMYKDLEASFNSIVSNDVVRTICGEGQRERVSLDTLCPWEELKSSLKPQQTFQVLDADSSQQRAIAVVKKGNNLVIEGPPGTGKSQTIANIIAEMLSEGKKTLFVSQKMAALEVVKRRLESVGLGDFCLELHSRKTNKRRVIEELADNLRSKQKADHTHDGELSKLARLRDELNTYAKEIGMPFGSLGITPHKAIGVVCSMPEIKDLEFIFADAESWDREKFEKTYDLLEKYSKNLANVNPPTTHPWFGSKLTELRYEQKLSVKNLFDEIITKHTNLRNHLSEISKISCFKLPENLQEIDNLLDGTKVLITIPTSAIEIFNEKKWHELESELLEISLNVKKFEQFAEWSKDKFELDIIKEDVEKIAENYEKYAHKFLFFISPGFRKNSKIIKKYKNKKYKPKINDLIESLKKVNNGKKSAEFIDNKGTLCKGLFGNLWAGRTTKSEQIENYSKWIRKFREHIKEKSISRSIFEKVSNEEFDKDEIEEARESLLGILNQYRITLNQLMEAIIFDAQKAFNCSLELVPIEQIDNKVKAMLNSIDEIEPWLSYQSILLECIENEMEAFINKCQQLQVPALNIPDTFRCQFLRCWLDVVFSERSTLKQFLGTNQQQLINKFCELDTKHLELSKIRLRHRLSGKVDASWESSSGSEMGILDREARKRRAHKPLRKLFKEIPKLLCELKPCLMMSPLTVAQFLDSELFKFDLVIFDEASQMPPEDSIGTIIRGQRIVVAGDTKQLPPTSFFQSAVLTPEDDESEIDEVVLTDLDSILDECATSGFPESMLLWHYRSRHEHLIAFSNKHLYGNNLYTFPNSEHSSETLGVRLNYLPDAQYQRGTKGANFDEAQEVAKAVFKHFREYPDKSLGIGTFSMRQKFAVEDAIEALRKEDSTLEEYFLEDKEEHFFVKNLETIQGDERDVIFISIGYGKNPSGVLPMNFGPLNQLGGERRLNVLVTRARYRLEIFSSIKGGDFDLSKTNSEGVHLLKKYLDFAEKGEIVLLQDICVDNNEEEDSPFEESVFNALAIKGIKAKKQVGCSGYKIDLAIVDKENPGRFILGVECDGATYHSSKTARDRDRLRQQVLEQLDWNIYRIWSTDWFRNPKRELEKLLGVIEQSQCGQLKKKLSVTKNHKITLSNPTSNSQKPPENYMKYKLTPILGRRDSSDFYYESKTIFYKKLERVVECEGPIHKDEAMRRVTQFWDFASVGKIIRETLENVIRYCVKNEVVAKRKDFLWPINMTKPPIRNRDGVEGVSKKFELIAPEEVGEAAILVLKKEYGMPLEDLVNQTARILGYKRVTESMGSYMKKCIENYGKSNGMERSNGKIILRG